MNSQFGFSKVCSTITVIIDFVCDLLEAFHSVNHQIMLYKLKTLGIRIKDKDLVSSYTNINIQI